MSNVKVSIETTPNPQTMKFLFSEALSSSQVDFRSPTEAERSPLAKKLFGFPWTAGVFLGTNFVSVTKQDWVDWEVLAEPLSGLIQEHFDRGEPLWSEETPITEDDVLETDSADVKTIKHLLNNEIKPMVGLDGGDVSFVKYEKGIVYLQLKGSCSGCPSSSATLKQGIEVRMKEVLPDILEVVSV